jgi:acetyl-CoA C-acetyltransferase
MPGQQSSVAIAGVYEYPDRLIGDLSVLGVKAVCARAALDDAGLGWPDVDGLYDGGETGLLGVLEFAEYAGIKPRVIDTTAVGGSSFEFHVAHAVRDIAAGRCNVAVLCYGSLARTQARAIGTGSRISTGPPTGASNMEDPYGLPLVGGYALVAQRHMHQYGTTAEQLAEVAVTARYHALRNPDARRALSDLGIKRTGELGTADVLGSPLVADPLHVLDCCLISDGGGAVVLVSGSIARSIRSRPVWVLGTGEALAYNDNGGDLTTGAAARSGPTAFQQAGLRPDEMDVAMIYDSFTITVLTILEDLGFCAKGEGGAYVEGGRLRFDVAGGPAVNTDGGGLSSNHPGMRGIFLLIEAVRQLRGQSTAQVAGARHAVAHGCGNQLGGRHSGATIVLGAH